MGYHPPPPPRERRPPPPQPGSPPPGLSPPGYPPPRYSAYPVPGAPPGYQGPYGPMPGRTDGYAIAALICSLIGLPAAFCYGVPAIILGLIGFFMGRSSLKRIQAASGMLSGHGLAQAGWIIGLVAAVLGVLAAVLYVILIAAALNNRLPANRLTF